MVDVANPGFSAKDVFPSYEFSDGRISIALTDLLALSSTEAAEGTTGDGREVLRAILEKYFSFLRPRQARPELMPKNFTLLKANPQGTGSNEFTQTYSVSFAISASPNNMTIKPEQDAVVGA